MTVSNHSCETETLMKVILIFWCVKKSCQQSQFIIFETRSWQCVMRIKSETVMNSCFCENKINCFPFFVLISVSCSVQRTLLKRIVNPNARALTCYYMDSVLMNTHQQHVVNIVVFLKFIIVLTCLTILLLTSLFLNDNQIPFLSHQHRF